MIILKFREGDSLKGRDSWKDAHRKDTASQVSLQTPFLILGGAESVFVYNPMANDTCALINVLCMLIIFHKYFVEPCNRD